MPYDYRMVPFQGAGDGSQNAWQQAANQMRDIVLQAQTQGWEFLSVEHLTHHARSNPGCLAALFGARAVDSVRTVDVLVFRKLLR